MKAEYNDCLLASPQIMEKIAREYHNKLNNSKQKQQAEPTDVNYQAIQNILHQVVGKLSILKNTCSSRFYMQKKRQVELIINNLYVIIDQIKENRTTKSYNYCSCIVSCLQDMSEALNLCAHLVEKNYNPQKVTKLIFTLSCAIKQTSLLIGQCKYRTIN